MRRCVAGCKLGPDLDLGAPFVLLFVLLFLRTIRYRPQGKNDINSHLSWDWGWDIILWSGVARQAYLSLPFTAQSVILHTDEKNALNRRNYTIRERTMWDERRACQFLLLVFLSREGGGGGWPCGFMGRKKKYNCGGWTLTPRDLLSDPSEHFLTSDLRALWLTQEIAAAPLDSQSTPPSAASFSDIWWKSRNENTMESLTLRNHAALTVGHHSPWIFLF